MIKKEEITEFVGQVIDVFEDFLDDKGVVIPNPEREADGEGNSANIYGSNYGNLQSRITELAENWNLIEGKSDSEDMVEDDRDDTQK